MKHLLGAALLLWAATAQAAVTWTVTRPQDCTAPRTPSGCCVIAAPGANPACLLKESGGAGFRRHFDLVSDGGTYTTGANGDVLNATALGYIGLAYVTYGFCTPSNGMDAVVTTDVTGKLVNIKLFTTANTELTAIAVATSVYLSCDFYGH